MYISVKFDSISKEECQEVIKYYNKNKLSTDNNLEVLDRAEGGFKINLDLDLYEESYDINKKFKQLRWSKGKILSSGLYIDFSNDEKILLYKSLCHVFGEDKVLLNKI